MSGESAGMTGIPNQICKANINSAGGMARPINGRGMALNHTLAF